MSRLQQVWQKIRPQVNAVTSRVTPVRGFPADSGISTAVYQHQRRFVTDAPQLLPYDVGIHHLRIALTAAQAAGIPHVVCPGSNGVSYRLIIKEPDAPHFYAELISQHSEDAVYATWMGDWGIATRLLRSCSADVLTAGDDVLVHTYLRTAVQGITSPYSVGCYVEPWVPSRRLKSRDGEVWAARRPNPRHSAVLWNDAETTTIDIPGIGPVPTLTAFLDDAMLTRPFPVDAVYLWVDDEDPGWRARRDEALVELGRTPPSDSADVSRFRHHGELRYSLRSLEYYAPWINRVFLVTDRQRPEWLTRDESVITVVDHHDIWDDTSALPVFNSHAITSRLHHIPGLADQYLYINDDVFMGSPVLPRNWFTPSGQPIFQNTSSTLPDLALRRDLPTHDNARYNSLDLVHRESGYRPTRLFMHGPIAQSRPWHEELERRYPSEYGSTAASRFRSATDLEPIWLHHYMGYAQGRTVPGNLRYEYVSMADPRAPERLAGMAADRRTQVFCINDDGAAPERNIEAVVDFLPRYFPLRSRFEID
ncbi:MAG: stealth family protein [Candidatus Nanopelagicales bacterium]